MFDSIMEGRVNLLDEIVSDLSSPEEDKDKKKEDKPILPLSIPIAMYYKDGELNPPLEMMEQVKIRRSTSRRRLLPDTVSPSMTSAKR